MIILYWFYNQAMQVHTIDSQSKPYIGRFAPSPTGPLHFGSLVAALASYLDALVHGGAWLLRIDDADLTRVQAGAAQTIQDQLRHYGFVWAGAVTHTQDFRSQHEQALQTLVKAGKAYACQCSRSQVAATARTSAIGEPVYAGTCRNAGLGATDKSIRALRWRCTPEPVCFTDRLLGEQQQNLAEMVGDFVLWRPETVTQTTGGLYNYQLTIVCDDHTQGISHVVRGADLLHNTARQAALYDALGYVRPSYAHVALVLQPDGAKLSKQHGAQALPFNDPQPYLCAAARHLGLNMHETNDSASFWRLATQCWEHQLTL